MAATGTAWERTPWHATQRASWEVLKKAVWLTTILYLAIGCSFGHPRILSGFGDRRVEERCMRQDGPHSGVDIAALVGADIIAPADSYVIFARYEDDVCGNFVLLEHSFGYITVYCHLSAYKVKAGDAVKRGDVIGSAGTSGRRPGPGYEHVHWEIAPGEDAGRSIAEDCGLFRSKAILPGRFVDPHVPDSMQFPAVDDRRDADGCQITTRSLDHLSSPACRHPCRPGQLVSCPCISRSEIG